MDSLSFKKLTGDAVNFRPNRARKELVVALQHDAQLMAELADSVTSNLNVMTAADLRDLALKCYQGLVANRLAPVSDGDNLITALSARNPKAFSPLITPSELIGYSVGHLDYYSENIACAFGYKYEYEVPNQEGIRSYARCSGFKSGQTVHIEQLDGGHRAGSTEVTLSGTFSQNLHLGDYYQLLYFLMNFPDVDLDSQNYQLPDPGFKGKLKIGHADYPNRALISFEPTGVVGKYTMSGFTHTVSSSLPSFELFIVDTLYTAGNGANAHDYLATWNAYNQTGSSVSAYTNSATIGTILSPKEFIKQWFQDFNFNAEADQITSFIDFYDSLVGSIPTLISLMGQSSDNIRLEYSKAMRQSLLSAPASTYLAAYANLFDMVDNDEIQIFNYCSGDSDDEDLS